MGLTIQILKEISYSKDYQKYHMIKYAIGGTDIINNTFCIWI